MPRLIGIAGLKTAGKDTTFQIIHELQGDGVKRAAFADKLKIMAMLALGYDGEPSELIDTANRLKEDGGAVKSRYDAISGVTIVPIPNGVDITGRQYLQNFGAYARQVFGENFWVDQVLPPVDLNDTLLGGLVNLKVYDRLKEIIDPWTLKPRGDFQTLCLTDVRYPNEAERVLHLGGSVWEIQRPGLVSDGHSSEVPLPRNLVTKVVDNSGTIYDLRKEIEVAL